MIDSWNDLNQNLRCGPAIRVCQTWLTHQFSCVKHSPRTHSLPRASALSPPTELLRYSYPLKDTCIFQKSQARHSHILGAKKMRAFSELSSRVPLVKHGRWSGRERVGQFV